MLATCVCRAEVPTSTIDKASVPLRQLRKPVREASHAASTSSDRWEPGALLYHWACSQPSSLLLVLFQFELWVPDLIGRSGALIFCILSKVLR